MDDGRERIDGQPVEQDLDPDEVGDGVSVGLVVQRRVTPRPRLQLIEEVEDDLGEGKPVVELDALG